MPVLTPLQGGEWIVARSTRRLYGFDPDGGKRVWVYPAKPEDDMDDALTTTLHQTRSRTNLRPRRRVVAWSC